MRRINSDWNVNNKEQKKQDVCDTGVLIQKRKTAENAEESKMSKMKANSKYSRNSRILQATGKKKMTMRFTICDSFSRTSTVLDAYPFVFRHGAHLTAGKEDLVDAQ